MDSKALTKIQSAALIAIIVAAFGGTAAYVLWSRPAQPTEDIKIGICANLDSVGIDVWRAAVLAAEQVNAEGGVLGRNLTIVGEDDDDGRDIAVASNALTRLMTVDNADFVVTPQAVTIIAFQDISAEHKKILFSVKSALVELTQRVIDDYDKYKYFFRVMNPNVTATVSAYADSVATLREYSSYNKIALITHDGGALPKMASGLNKSLIANGFDIVYNKLIPTSTTDFASYLSGIEAAGAEILYPLLAGNAGVLLVNEWYERQSPCVIWGNVGRAGDSDFPDLTAGRCESVSFNGWPVIAGYPLTSKTVPAREAYVERWGETVPNSDAAAAYDVVRFILPDAIKRAGTIETEAVVGALEKTSVETSLATRFAFTSSHDVMMTPVGSDMLGEGYLLPCLFQWQNGTQVPVYPKALMEKTGATFTYPAWLKP